MSKKKDGASEILLPRFPDISPLRNRANRLAIRQGHQLGEWFESVYTGLQYNECSACRLRVTLDWREGGTMEGKATEERCRALPAAPAAIVSEEPTPPAPSDTVTQEGNFPDERLLSVRLKEGLRLVEHNLDYVRRLALLEPEFARLAGWLADSRTGVEKVRALLPHETSMRNPMLDKKSAA